MGRADLAVARDVRAFLEVADPQVVGVVPAPALSHGLAANPELHARCAGGFQMPVQRRSRNLDPVARLDEPVDDPVRTIGLFFFQFHCGGKDLRVQVPPKSPVGSLLSLQRVKAALPVLSEFPAQRGQRRLADPAVGEPDILFSDGFQVCLFAFRLDV